MFEAPAPVSQIGSSDGRHKSGSFTRYTRRLLAVHRCLMMYYATVADSKIIAQSNP